MSQCISGLHAELLSVYSEIQIYSIYALICYTLKVNLTSLLEIAFTLYINSSFPNITFS